MRLLFLCGSLEPGKDGVGDYTLRLAEALRSFGVHVKCIAINDPYVSSTHDVPDIEKNISQSTLRLPSSYPWSRRFTEIIKVINEWEPTWISLQYVPYSFSAKGIPLVFTLLLLRVSRRAHWHIMFHELWISRRPNIKSFVISILQELLIRLTCKILNPALINTSIDFYKWRLKRFDIQSEILPLFSNIPNFTRDSHSNLSTTKFWNFVFFGSLDPKWQPEPFFTLVEESRQLSQILNCNFIKVGRLSSKSQELWDLIVDAGSTSKYSHFHFYDVGEQSPSSISKILNESTFGVSMAPLMWIGKSGSVAAMMEHGLPIIVPVYEGYNNESQSTSAYDNNFILIDSGLPLRLRSAKRWPVSEQCTKIAFILYRTLLSCTAKYPSTSPRLTSHESLKS